MITINFSRRIEDYKPILEGLIDDFGYVYYHAILCWCQIISDKDNQNCFWRVYLIDSDGATVGICGLYSQYPNNNDELWLGWFGILKEYRRKGIGTTVLSLLQQHAILIGAKRIMSYVDKSGEALPFYIKNGFQTIGSVKEYLSKHPNLSMDRFEDPEDFVICKEIEAQS